jgi:small-conductance mechanosensitive channel
MRYTTVTYARVKNLGNYESERLELTVEIAEDEQVNEVTEILICKVEEILEIIDPVPVV